ncbi:MAG: lactate utilization protein [Clostridia bacterium]|nr:lactate utilization protein [Clostridia bacterium]
MTDLIRTTAAALQKRGFTVHCAETGAEAAQHVLSLVQPGMSVGAGGSMTIRELGLAEAIRDLGCDVHWHWLEEGPAAFGPAREADLYLCSANAVTAEGQLVNIDGTGNRVAAMIHGPKQVVAVAGVNKLVDGGIPTAIARIKREACPPNARRLNLPFPCGQTGKCNPAECPGGFCNVVTVQEHPTGKRPYHVVLVNEALGY